MSLRACLLSLVMLGFGCGSEEPSRTVAGPRPLPTGPGWGVQTFCEEWTARADAWCTWLETCCTGLPRPDSVVGNCSSVHRTVEDCTGIIAMLLESSGATWDGTNAEQCVLAGTPGVPPSACDGAHIDQRPGWPSAFTGYLFLIPECRLLITGTKPPGSACLSEYECRPPFQCYYQSGDPPEKTRVCASHRLVGESCSEDLNCVDGLRCVGYDGVCSKPGKVGSPCVHDVECAAGLLCSGNGTFGLEGVCGTAVGLGSPCAATSLCKHGLRCEAGVCVPAKADGSSCNEEHDECLGRCKGYVCVSACGGAYY